MLEEVRGLHSGFEGSRWQTQDSELLQSALKKFGPSLWIQLGTETSNAPTNIEQKLKKPSILLHVVRLPPSRAPTHIVFWALVPPKGSPALLIF